jgi:hypothetical protein
MFSALFPRIFSERTGPIKSFTIFCALDCCSIVGRSHSGVVMVREYWVIGIGVSRPGNSLYIKSSV